MITFTDHAKDKLLKEFNKLGVTERTVIYSSELRSIVNKRRASGRWI